MAPEIVSGKGFDLEIDVYAYGVMFNELFTCERPYSGAIDVFVPRFVRMLFLCFCWLFRIALDHLDVGHVLACSKRPSTLRLYSPLMSRCHLLLIVPSHL